ncbi:LuxR C-terminal-related transcriptional regulator [Lentzea sp. NPDC058436]|uniref:helix-turn-helix transcriptional regulator n=1 Tax=Lentzea sp. NPDC058436 TaxID=3346499 RepID=UPI003650EC0D
MNKIKVAVYAADPLTHAGVSRQLRSTPGVELVTGAMVGQAAVTVLVLEETERAATASLRRATRQVTGPVVLVKPTGHEPNAAALADLAVGAVLAREDADEVRLLAAVREVDRMDASAPITAAVEEPVAKTVLPAHRTRPSAFSEREKDVLRLIADGLDTAAVAERLMFSERTVKYIVHALTLRLNLRNRSHAVAHALRTGAI